MEKKNGRKNNKQIPRDEHCEKFILWLSGHSSYEHCVLNMQLY